MTSGERSVPPATARSRETATGAPGLDRSLPLTRLPGMLSDPGAPADVVTLEHLPIGHFPPTLVKTVLQPAVDDIVETVVGDLDTHLPTPISGGALEHNVRRAVDDAIQQFVAAVIGGRPELDRGLSRELGAKHARAGLPLSELTTLFARGSLACWRGVLRLHQDAQLPQDLIAPASEVVLAFAQELCVAAVEGYTHEVGEAGTTMRSQQVELVRRLLSDAPLSLDEARVQAEAVGWSLPERLAAAVTSPDPRLSGAVSWPDELLAAPHGARWCLLLPAHGTEVVHPTVPDGVTVAIGPVVAWNEAGRSLEVAEDLLGLAVGGTVPDAAVLRSGEHAPVLVLARDRLIAEDLVLAHLGPLLEVPEHRRRPLLETLAAWVRRPGHHTAIAEALDVSVRTVRYRMDRLRELLGDRVDDPDQRLPLALAVQALQAFDPIDVIVLEAEDQRTPI